MNIDPPAVFPESETEVNELIFSLNQLTEDSNSSSVKRAREAFVILLSLSDLLIRSENLRFTTLFARISYLSVRWKLAPKATFAFQTYRRVFEKSEFTETNSPYFLSIAMPLARILKARLTPGADSINELFPEMPAEMQPMEESIGGFKRVMDGVIQTIDFKKQTLTFIEEKSGGDTWTVQFDKAAKNDLFTSNLEAAVKILQLPLPVILVDVELHRENVLVPAAFVLNPDYLVDVTSIASAVAGDNGEYWLYSLQKLTPKETGQAVLVGNLANLILDTLVNDEETDFESLIPVFFHQDALSWCLQKDDEVIQNLEKLNIHYKNIKRVIQSELESKGIQKQSIYLEPSFYCRTYGIQGRLDFFHHNYPSDQAEIIELKSSLPFMPNAYGLTESHYLQTLLYDLIVQATFQGKIKTRNFILYSRLENDALKFAPSTRTRQIELIRTRNEIMLIEHAFAHSADTAARLCSFMKENNFKNIKGYIHTDLKAFENCYQQLDDIEKTYYHHYLSFAAREQILAKTGEAGPETTNGLAALWLEDIESKAERFSILSHLRIAKNESSHEDPLLTLEPTHFSNALSNFRKGDVVVLYPHTGKHRDALSHQVFKCNLVSLSNHEIVLRLRSPQRNQQMFDQTDLWNLEGDVLDSGFRHMYKNLFLFIQSDVEKRRLIMGRSRPEIFKINYIQNLPSHLTPEQKNIVSKIVSCKDYFLLWGPPGTGKTSIVIRHAVRAIYDTTPERVLLLAYTNRAVDEINECLQEEGLEQNLSRLGSSYAVDGRYTHTLLQNQIGGMTKRKEINAYLKNTRIYLSTVSSLMGKLSLLDLLEFDTVIIDEASQILEPNLCGLLTKFKRFVLIGDHKQLPAVVVQKPLESKINDTSLHELQITDARNSLFERLLLQARKKDWFHCWDVLSQQGRMHQQIMDFVNNQFYEGRLKAIPGLDRLFAPQFLPPDTGWPTARILFANIANPSKTGFKTNEMEADLVVSMVDKIRAAYLKAGINMHEHSIGIITPYRAQIALIRSKMKETNHLQIDTVERFQGGAKDIIIISLVTNRSSQLRTLVSLSSDGVDRKLNVALTRAREQIIVIGNEDILKKESTYRALIASSTRYV